MLRSIRITNFKAFGETQTVPLAPITLIYGPNSAGKSSIIQSILLMRQSLQGGPLSESKLIFSGDDVNLGTYTSALYQHNTERKMAFEFEYLPARYRPVMLFGGGFPRNTARSVHIALDIEKAGPKEQWRDASITDVEYRLHDRPSRCIRLARTLEKKIEVDDSEDGAGATDFQLKDNESVVALYDMLRGIRNARIKPQNENSKDDSKAKERLAEQRFLKNLRFATFGILPSRPDPEQFAASQAVSAITQTAFSGASPLETFRREFTEEFSSVSYLGPLRSPPARHYIISGSDKASVGTRGERMPQLMYRRKRQVLPILNATLEDFGIPYKVDIKSAGNSLTGDIITIALSDKNAVEVSPSDVGFGIGQLLPILVEGIISVGKTICVEQPEIHLHPRLQGNVANFLVSTAKSTGVPAKAGGKSTSEVQHGGNQWIIETHSESIMLRLQTLIRQRSIPSEFVSILYVEPIQGGSKVMQLRLSEDGDFIDEWPGGFFEEAFEEIFLRRK